MIMNLGTLFIVGLFILVQYPLYYCARGMNGHSCCRKFQDKLEEGLFWSNFLDYVMQSYIELAFAVVINLYNLVWEGWGTYFSNALTVPYGLLVIFFPVYVYYFMTKYYDLFRYDAFKKIYGPIFYDLEPWDTPEVKWQPILYLMRRLIIVIICVTLTEYICF